jgi:hypothetical protein
MLLLKLKAIIIIIIIAINCTYIFNIFAISKRENI